MQWADVVDEVLDLMNIDMCSVMAHSAGAPYALSFANKYAHRIHGDVCLLAPWVGGSENSGFLIRISLGSNSDIVRWIQMAQIRPQRHPENCPGR